MVITLAAAWRLALAMAFCGAIFMSACARAPRQSVPGTELRRLVICALILYSVGAAASLSHHEILAGLVYGSGIMVSALAAWLSRGRDQEDPPDGDEPVDEPPPPEPDGVPPLDWAAFEREFRAWERRQREVSKP
jgi:uncharacterized membrane protein